MHASVVPLWGAASGQGWRQLGELGFALVLSTAIGWERGAQQKSAGLRTHTLVGVASALMMLVSQFGFPNVLGLAHFAYDPSRVAAQIVSGIGFIGGGLIFVRRDVVRGLTTAATVWLTAAVGMACGGGLPVLAAAVTVLHFLVTRGYGLLAEHFRLGAAAEEPFVVRLRYRSGSAVLPRLMQLCTGRGFRILQVTVDRLPQDSVGVGGAAAADGAVAVLLRLEGPGDAQELGVELFQADGVLGVDILLEPERDE